MWFDEDLLWWSSPEDIEDEELTPPVTCKTVVGVVKEGLINEF